MNNRVFGKTMENIQNSVDVRLVWNREQAAKLLTKLNFDRCVIFDENLIAIRMEETKLSVTKPSIQVYVSQILVRLMYDFHYNTMKQIYEDRAKLLFTYTDSLIFEIETEDFCTVITR